MNRASSGTAIVVGAGIVGAASAMYLSRAGFAVTVLDAGFPGCGTTAAGMGHLVVMDDSEAQFSLTSYSLRLWRELFDEFGMIGEAEQTGTLWIAADEEEFAAVLAKREYYTRRGVEVQVLDADEVARAEPSLRRPLAGALRVPRDCVVYPPTAAAFMLAAATRGGARVESGWRVQKLEARAVVGDRGRMEADVVINAAGNDAGALSPEIELRPRRGHLVITDRYPGEVRHQIVELGYLKSAHEMSGESVAFNVQPRSTGQILIGSSRELGTREAAINNRVLARMLTRALHFMPALRAVSVTRVWTGARPTSADKLPFIGESREHDGVWIAAGHEGLGITTSVASARLLTDLILGAAPAIDPAPYSPARAGAVWS